MANIKVSIINSSTVLSDGDIAAVIPAFQTQVHEHFYPAWGIDADLAFVPSGQNPDAGSWWLAILDNADVAGALGYHDYTPDGLPLGKSFAGTDIQLGYKWTVTTTHELLEMVADPDINLAAMAPDLNQPSPLQFYAHEVCDACEADNYAYNINGVPVTDFVFPTWFESFRNPGSTQFDYQGQINQPFQILPGGYIGVLNLSGGEGWTQITAAKHAQIHTMRAPIGSRRERRRTPRQLWSKSLDIKEIHKRHEKLRRGGARISIAS